MAKFFIGMIIIVLYSSRCFSYFVNRCQGNIALPEFSLFAKNETTFGNEIQCATECMTIFACLGYFFRDIRHGPNNCIHIPNVLDCSVLDIGEYGYKTKVGIYPIPSTCFDVQKYVNAQDGEYCLKIDDTAFGTKIYCHNMNSTVPDAYVTLPDGGHGNYISTWHHDSNIVQGDVYFEKLRLHISSLDIAASDLSFTYSTRWSEGAGDILYGKAVSCDGQPNGIVSMNFTGTGLFIPNEVQRMSSGNRPRVIQDIRSADNQYIFWECSGNCGRCFPQNSSLSETTYDLSSFEDRILPMAYDRRLDKTTCKFTRDRAGVYTGN